MRTMSWGSFFLTMLLSAASFFLGYTMDASHKAERLYDLKAPHIVYRDTCFYQFNPVKTESFRDTTEKQTIKK